MRPAGIRFTADSEKREALHGAALAPPAAREEASLPTDAELLARLRQGETAALDLVLGRYWALVVDYITRLTGTRDAAQDAAQRAFCQLWDRRAGWRGTGSLGALLCQMARNFALSERRRDGARERSTDVFLLSPPSNPTPDVEFENDQLRLALERAIAALPVRRREVFVLHSVHGLAYREIADVLGISVQTVANQLCSAMRTLRSELGPLLD